MAIRLARSIIKWRIAGDYAENVFNWMFDNDSLNDWEAAIALYNSLVRVDLSPNGFMPRLRAISSEDAFISTISTRVFHPLGGNRYANQLQTNERAGAIASPIYTGEIAMCINFLSLVEPSKQGRVFLPAVPTSFVEGGRWTPTAVIGANNFSNAVVAGVTDDTTTFYPIIWRAEDETYREISDGYLSPNVGQMSKRGMGE